MGFARIHGAQPGIPHAQRVTVEADVSKGLHQFALVGLPDKAVEESRDRVSSAIKNSGFKSPKHSNLKIVVSLAPAHLKKEGALFDVPIALAYLRAAEEISFDTGDALFVGELGLDGSVRAIHGTLSVARAAAALGHTELFVPQDNAEEAALVSSLTVYPVTSLSDIVHHFTKPQTHRIAAHTARTRTIKQTHTPLDEIRGQLPAKRALEIAAAGEHNIAFYGPPGTGKTMLARALASILPPLSHDDVLEVTTIHSVAGRLSAVITEPPFRAPHHTASYASMVGGGATVRPGEVTLAHRGVLFLDEFPEFHRDVINALREPLEDRVVSVTRAKGAYIFPAHFMLVAALNPCPCGYAGSARCTCLPLTIEKYKKKVSGPIADRIDMWVRVAEIPHEELSVKRVRTTTKETQAARERVHRARTTQAQRFAHTPHTKSNAGMKARDIETLSELSEPAERILVGAAKKLGLSSRGYHRTIKLARTIADLAGSSSINPEHMLEALQYRERH